MTRHRRPRPTKCSRNGYRCGFIPKKMNATQIQSTQFQFTQINLQHSRKASAVLYRCLAKLHTGVAMVQEPWIFKNKVQGLNVRGTEKFSAPPSVAPRSCIVASRNVNPVALPQFCTRDLTVIQVEYLVDNSPRQVVIASAYMPLEKESRPPTPEMEKLKLLSKGTATVSSRVRCKCTPPKLGKPRR